MFLTLATAAFKLSTEAVDRAWYRELEQVSSVAADIGGVTSTHINHLTPASSTSTISTPAWSVAGST